ncbi:MAG: hypothetical protein GXO56_01625 [Chloroflexi bacterium]|nr:hypothetical protein [Chloroflexota bacterium]
MKPRLWWALLLLALAGCGGHRAATEVPAAVAFVPPTEAAGGAAVAPTPTPSPVPPTAAAARTCTNMLTFVEDETIPDGTVVKPGQKLDKRWRVKNAGTCNWDGRYRLKHVAGQALGAPEEMALFPARAGTEVTLRIVFTAPEKPGQYFSTWQAFDPQGQPFGDPVYMQIVVAEATKTP